MVSLTYRAGVDDPARFTKSKAVGAFFGLTPRRYQSGETDVTGSITKFGDAGVRTALHDAANALLTRATRFSTLKRWALDVAKRRGMRRAKVALARKLATVLHRMWALDVAKRRGMRKAKVALARKLATVLHRMWADGTEFVWGKDLSVTAAA